MTYTEEEKIERHRKLMRDRYRAGVRYQQLDAAKKMVREVQSLPYEQAVDHVQARYRIKEFKQGE